MKITKRILEAYLNCKHKAHLLLKGETGTPHDYEVLMDELQAEYKPKATEALSVRCTSAVRHGLPVVPLPQLKVKDEYRSKKRELEDLVWQITPVPKEKKISLDGNLDDAAWSEAKSVTLVPINGEDPLVKTTVSGLWMPDTLYLACDCRETKIGNLRILDRERDERDASQDPSVEFFLLPSSDDTTYFRFVVTANGSVGDAKVNIGSAGLNQHDWNWNSSVEAAAVIGETGWTAEIAVPMQQIVADGVKTGDRLVANVGRGRNLVDVETEENQFYSWSPFVRGSFQDTRRFGSIVLVDKPQASTSLVSNGSFEAADKRSPAPGWHFPREPEERELVTIDESTYRDGSRCLRLSDAKTRLLITQYLPPLKPGRRASDWSETNRRVRAPRDDTLCHRTDRTKLI